MKANLVNRNPINQTKLARGWLGAAMAALILMCLAVAPGRSAGFVPGQLLVSDTFGSVYTVHAMTGASNRIVSGAGSLGDIVFNPVTRSAFVVSNESVILELKHSEAAGFVLSPFLQGLRRVTALAVDPSGNIFFNQEESVSHRIWMVTPDRSVSAVTPSIFSLFVPEHMAVSADGSKLYVASSPDGSVTVISLPGGAYTELTGTLSFPSGVDVDIFGNVYVTDDPFSGGRIVKITPNGMATTHAPEPAGSSGFLGDLEYDDTENRIFLAVGGSLYLLAPDLTYRRLFTGSSLQGISMISAGLTNLIVTQPLSQTVSIGGSATFAVATSGGGPFSFQWMLNGTNITGATSASLGVTTAAIKDAGAYTVLLRSPSGAVASEAAILTVIDLNPRAVLTIAGSVGTLYGIDFAPAIGPTNAWQRLTNIVLQTSPYFFVDQYSMRGEPYRFYRAIALR